jgi:fructosamine-3-kinase
MRANYSLTDTDAHAWKVKNARRARLIKEQCKRPLTPAERRELRLLQRAAAVRITKAATFDRRQMRLLRALLKQ